MMADKVAAAESAKSGRSALESQLRKLVARDDGSSAQETIRDQKTLKREAEVSLSKLRRKTIKGAKADALPGATLQADENSDEESRNGSKSSNRRQVKV